MPYRTRTLNQQARREESTGTSLRSALKSKVVNASTIATLHTSASCVMMATLSYHLFPMCQNGGPVPYTPAQEDELANLQRSLQALSGPAETYRATSALLSRSAGSDFPGTGSTGIFCKGNQAQTQQLHHDVQQGPTEESGLQGSAPQSTAAVASVQQPRPAFSLVTSSIQQRSRLTVRQNHIPQLNPMQSPSLSQAEAGPHHHRGGRPELANLATAQYNGVSMESLPSQPNRQGPGDPAWKQRPFPYSSKDISTQQHSQRAAQKMLTAYPACSHLQMQAPASAAGQSDSYNSGGVAQQAGGAAAAHPALQCRGGAKQPGAAGHPAMSPSLAPVPYTVQEPDSPPPQGAEIRQGAPATPHAQRPPACIFMETTITRWGLRFSARSVLCCSTVLVQSRNACTWQMYSCAEHIRAGPLTGGWMKDHHTRQELRTSREHLDNTEGA